MSERLPPFAVAKVGGLRTGRAGVEPFAFGAQSRLTLSKYDTEYYFLLKPTERDDLPSLTPDENTATRQFRSNPQPAGSAPLVFFNGARDQQKKMGSQVVAVPPPILFDGANLVIDERVWDRLKDSDIPDMYAHPAVYIHDDGQWHDNYWYIGFSQQFDCWDRETSLYLPDPLSFGATVSYTVIDFHLNDSVVEATPLDQRLLFEMGATTTSDLVCHESLLGVFAINAESGAKAVRIDKYAAG